MHDWRQEMDATAERAQTRWKLTIRNYEKGLADPAILKVPGNPIIVQYDAEGDSEEDAGGQLPRGGDGIPVRESDSGMDDSKNTLLEYHVSRIQHCFHQMGVILPKTENDQKIPPD